MRKSDQIPEELAERVMRIGERVQAEVLELLMSRNIDEPRAPTRAWMTATQLAEYWQLYNDKNEPTTAGILKWCKRPPDRFPLPHGYMGDLLRFNRHEVDGWAKEEAERRRVQKEKRQLRIA